MKMKKKVLAILMVLMFFAIPFSFAQAEETTVGKNNSMIEVEIATVNEDGSFITEIFTMTKAELAEFESTISTIISAIVSSSSLEEILNIFDNLPQQQGLIKNIIKILISGLRNLKNRGFVISQGQSYKLNPLKKNSFKIRHRTKFWYYSSGTTMILKPFRLKFDLLRGRQYGLMSNFLGFYIYIAKSFPQKSRTIFMGTARSINCRELFSLRR
jgi:hypothetical protein